MRRSKLVFSIAPVLVILLIAFSFPATFASNGNGPLVKTSTTTVIAETGWVHYFTTAGGLCTGSAWSDVQTDGNVGYPNNVGGPQPTAAVNLGSTVCIKIELNHVPYTSPGSTLYAQVNAQSSVSNGIVNSTNGVDITIIWKNENSNPGGSCTVPTFVGTQSQPNQGPDKEDVGHLIYGNCGTSSTTSSTVTTPTQTQGVPEFPLAGGLGLLVLVGLAIPLLIVMRRWRASFTLK